MRAILSLIVVLAGSQAHSARYGRGLRSNFLRTYLPARTQIFRTTNSYPRRRVVPFPHTRVLAGESQREWEAKGRGVDQGEWRWKEMGLDVHYIVAGDKGKGKEKPILFLPGFGAGSFHFEEAVEYMGVGRQAYCMDWIGQGNSWPKSSADYKEGFQYSPDLWLEQARHFIEEVIQDEVYIAGNSLGGYMAAQLAAEYPHLVKGLILYNATPVWGFRPRKETDGFLSNLLWDGSLPAPEPYKRITDTVFNNVKNKDTVHGILKDAYSNSSTVTNDLVDKILRVGEQPEGSNAFASILFSPKTKLSFAESLEICAKNEKPLLLLYGKDDPWVAPLWGQRAYLNLLLSALRYEKPLSKYTRYFEVENCGHCPHDESPEIISKVTEEWVESMDHGTVPDFEEYFGEGSEQGKKEPHLKRRDALPPRDLYEWIGTAVLRYQLRNGGGI